jgi:hypothetical protein
MITSRMIRWVGHAACIVEMRNSYKICQNTRREERVLGRHREDNIKILKK